MVLGSAIILIGMLSNFFKEQIIEKESNSTLDSLKSTNKMLVEIISGDIEKRDTLFEKYKAVFENITQRKNFKIVEPEIVGFKPTIYFRERTDLKTQDWPTSYEYGIFFIAKIKAGSQPISINSLKVKAKLFLDLDQYLRFDEVTINRKADDIERERVKKRPYVLIDWDAYISEKSIIRNLYPNQIGFFGFALLEHSLSGQAEGGWELPKTKYLGYDDGILKPFKIRKYPDFSLLFSDYMTYKLYPQKIRTDIEFYIILDSKEFHVKKERIMAVDRVNEYEWQKDSFEKMYLRYFAE